MSFCHFFIFLNFPRKYDFHLFHSSIILIFLPAKILDMLFFSILNMWLGRPTSGCGFFNEVGYLRALCRSNFQGNISALITFSD